MIGWLILGLVIGFAAGLASGWFLLGRRASAEAGASSLAPEPSLAEPVPGGEQTDEEMSQALDATRGLLDELEERYRGKTAAGPDEETKPARRRSSSPRSRGR